MAGPKSRASRSGVGWGGVWTICAATCATWRSRPRAASPCSGWTPCCTAPAPDVLVEHRQAIGCSRSARSSVDEDVVLPDELDDVARVGTTFRAAAGFEQLRVAGTGSRRVVSRSAPRGRVRPLALDGDGSARALSGAPGARAAPRHPLVRLSSGSGTNAGLLVGAIEPDALAFSASHYSADDLWRARDLTELVPRDDVMVHSTSRTGVWAPSAAGPTRCRSTASRPAGSPGVGACGPYDPKRDDVATLARVVQTGTEATKAGSSLGP